MIVDWISQCEKIEATGVLKRDDPSDNKSFFRQEIIFLRYLIDKGVSRQDILTKWKSIKNGVAAMFTDDEQKNIQFLDLYNRAMSKHYAFVSKARKLQPVTITEEEVRRLNAIKARQWVREYFLVLLVYDKFVIQTGRAPEYSPTLSNWIMRQIHAPNSFRSFRDARAAITKVIRTDRPRHVVFRPSRGSHRYSTFEIPYGTWPASPARVVVNTLDDVCQVLDVIRPDVRKCSVCGCEFPLGAKTKRDMCDSCYRKYRRGYKTAKDYTYYHKKSSKSSIPDRNTAVTINGRGMNKN